MNTIHNRSYCITIDFDLVSHIGIHLSPESLLFDFIKSNPDDFVCLFYTNIEQLNFKIHLIDKQVYVDDRIFKIIFKQNHLPPSTRCVTFARLEKKINKWNINIKEANI